MDKAGELRFCADLCRCRMTYFSAHTKYALVDKGVKYDSVKAEYV